MRIASTLIALLTLIVVVATTFQNCADVQFTTESSSQSEENSPVEDVSQRSGTVEGPFNGDGYSGKVTRYIQWSEPDECSDEGISIKGEIEETGGQFFATIEECIEIPAQLIEASLVEKTATGIVFNQLNYDRILPLSCLEIYQNGGDNLNGFYTIDPDGSGPDSAVRTYCDMTAIGGGWSTWEEWGTCDAACGAEGTQQRTRICYSGSCSGDAVESRSCQGLCP